MTGQDQFIHHSSSPEHWTCLLKRKLHEDYEGPMVGRVMGTEEVTKVVLELEEGLVEK